MARTLESVARRRLKGYPVVARGEAAQSRERGQVLPWSDLDPLLDAL